MSTSLIVFLSVAGIVIGVGALWATYFAFTKLRASVARPRLWLTNGPKWGQIALGMSWKPSAYPIQPYRFIVGVLSPHHSVKERRFSVTLDAPAREPFLQPVELPEFFKELLREGHELGGRQAVVSVSARTLEGLSVEKSFFLRRFRKICDRKSVRTYRVKQLELRTEDEPTISTLDYFELEARKERLEKLVEQAKAKELAKKKPKEGAAAKPAVKAPAPPEAKEEAPKGADASNPPASVEEKAASSSEAKEETSADGSEAVDKE